MNLTAIIYPEDEMFVSLCPELDIASQGMTMEEAHHNLQEAVEGVLEVATDAEIARRLTAPPVAMVAPLRIAPATRELERVAV